MSETEGIFKRNKMLSYHINETALFGEIKEHELLRRLSRRLPDLKVCNEHRS